MAWELAPERSQRRKKVMTMRLTDEEHRMLEREMKLNRDYYLANTVRRIMARYFADEEDPFTDAP